MVIGKPSLPRVDAVQLPATHDGVLHAGRVAGEALAAADRYVVDKAAHETVIDVEVRQAVVALRIVVVQEPLPAVEIGRADAGRRRFGVGALRPGIRKRQQRAAAAVLQFRVEGVVLRPAAPVAVDVDDEVGIRLALGDRRALRAVLQRLRDVAPHEEVRALRADVVDLERRVRKQLALHPERPLLHVRVSRLGRLADREERVRGGRGQALGAAKLGKSASEVRSGVGCPTDWM